MILALCEEEEEEEEARAGRQGGWRLEGGGKVGVRLSRL